MTLVFFEDLYNSLAEYQKQEFLQNILPERSDVGIDKISDQELIDEIRYRQIDPEEIFDEREIVACCEGLGYSVDV